MIGIPAIKLGILAIMLLVIPAIRLDMLAITMGISPSQTHIIIIL